MGVAKRKQPRKPYTWRRGGGVTERSRHSGAATHARRTHHSGRPAIQHACVVVASACVTRQAPAGSSGMARACALWGRSGAKRGARARRSRGAPVAAHPAGRRRRTAAAACTPAWCRRSLRGRGAARAACSVSLAPKGHCGPKAPRGTAAHPGRSCRASAPACTCARGRASRSRRTARVRPGCAFGATLVGPALLVAGAPPRLQVRRVGGVRVHGRHGARRVARETPGAARRSAGARLPHAGGAELTAYVSPSSPRAAAARAPRRRLRAACGGGAGGSCASAAKKSSAVERA